MICLSKKLEDVVADVVKIPLTIDLIWLLIVGMLKPIFKKEAVLQFVQVTVNVFACCGR